MLLLKIYLKNNEPTYKNTLPIKKIKITVNKLIIYT